MLSLAGTNKQYVEAKGRVTKKGNLMVVVDAKNVSGFTSDSWQENDEGNGKFVKLVGEFKPLRAITDKKWFDCQVRADGHNLQISCNSINRPYGFSATIL